MENCVKYLWNHEPFVSAPPCKMYEYNFLIGGKKKQDVDEAAVFELENGKFLFIRFYGNAKSPDQGYTEIEEFETLEEAKKLYRERL